MPAQLRPLQVASRSAELLRLALPRSRRIHHHPSFGFGASTKPAAAAGSSSNPAAPAAPSGGSLFGGFGAAAPAAPAGPPPRHPSPFSADSGRALPCCCPSSHDDVDWRSLRRCLGSGNGPETRGRVGSLFGAAQDRRLLRLARQAEDSSVPSRLNPLVRCTCSTGLFGANLLRHQHQRELLPQRVWWAFGSAAPAAGSTHPLRLRLPHREAASSAALGQKPVDSAASSTTAPAAPAAGGSLFGGFGAQKPAGAAAASGTSTPTAAAAPRPRLAPVCSATSVKRRRPLRQPRYGQCTHSGSSKTAGGFSFGNLGGGGGASGSGTTTPTNDGSFHCRRSLRRGRRGQAGRQAG